jgi:signal transduction histidine kinase/ligand-binding sensor domain-containing protein
MLRSLLLIHILFLPFGALSQQLRDKIEFEHIAIPGTMSSAMVDDVVQDSLGMIWIAKLSLHRYDGKKFKSYSIIYPDSVPLNGKEITKLFWDSKKNRLLIGTRNHGLLQFRYEDNRVLKLPCASGTPIVNNIEQTSDGKIWIASFSSGLFALESDTLVRKFSLQQMMNPSALAVDGEDLWVSSSHKINVLRKGVVRRIISIGELTPDWKGVSRVSALLITREGVWAGTDRHGVVRFDPATLKSDRYFSPLVSPFFSAVSRFQKDKEGQIWILTKNNGIDLYDEKSDRHLHLVHNPGKNSSLSSDVCVSSLVDRQGIVWIGSAGALNKYDPNRIKFDVFNHDPNNPASLSDDNVRAIYEDDKGIVWLATADGFINLLDRKKRSSERIKVEVRGHQKFISPLYFCEIGNEMLVGSSEGLLVFDRARKRFGFYKPLEERTKGRTVRQLARDGNTIYIHCLGRLIVFDLDKKQIQNTEPLSNLTGVTFLSVDQEHNLWIGNLGGVSRFNPTDNSFQSIKIEPDKFRPDSSFFLVLAIEPKENEVWVNTFNTGIFILSHDDQGNYIVEKRLTTKDGLPDNTVYGSLTDNRSNVWLSTNSGLALYNHLEKEFITFGPNEGVQDVEFNRLAYFKNRRGEMYFGGINGINIFHPDSVDIRTSDPKPQIIGVSVFKNLSPEDSYENYFTFINSGKNPQLDYTEKNLKFDFFVADYHEPSRYEVFYRLQPLDGAWHKSENQNSAVYANLKPGDYTFEVKTKNSENKELLSSSSFTIQPPFWSTWWFISLATIGSFFIVIIVIKTRIASAEAEQKRLAQLLKMRTSEIEKSHEELENLNRKKDLIFSILSHDLRSPLTTLKGFLGMLIENVETITKDDLKKYSISIRNSVTNSLDLIDNTLYWSLSQTDSIQYNPTTVTLGTLFTKIKGLYQLTAEKKQIKLDIDDVNGISVLADENMLYVLLRNLVSNAIKFTSEGKTVSLTAAKNSHWVEIKITDEGIGMSELEISKIFTLDNPQVKRGTSSEKGTGLGLLLCKKFIEVNGGKLNIRSAEGEGSEFSVSLPIKNDDHSPK